LDVFSGHPWFGVGLGQSGFFLLDHIPLWAYDRRSEIMLLLAPNSTLFPNPKNLWVRLLAETGIIGMAAFLIWIGMVFAASVYLMGRTDKNARFLGTAGIMMCTAILAEGFSLDSFALPTMWIAFGFLTSATWQALEEAHPQAGSLG
jgi:O-antigen ligase